MEYAEKMAHLDNRILVPVAQSIDLYDLEGTIEEVVWLLERHNKDLIAGRIDIDHDAYEYGVDVHIRGYREPTDAELRNYEQREAQRKLDDKARRAAVRKQKSEAKQKADLEALKIARKAFPEKFKD
jgi:hypothetical protein